MKTNPFRFVALTCALICAPVLGATPVQVKLVLVEGAPPEAQFNDGRKAQMVINRKGPLMFAVPFQVTDNTCNGRTKVLCTIRTSILQESTALVWTVNPDPAKIGNIVEKRQKQSDPVTSEFLFYFDRSLKATFPKITLPIPDDVISCQDFSWLPQGTVAAPKRVDLVRWDAENMVINPETGLEENRTTSIAADVTLAQNSLGELVATKSRYLQSNLNLAFSTLDAMILTNADGLLCSITLQPNPQDFSSAFEAYQNTPAHYTTYLYDSDEYSKLGGSMFLYESFFLYDDEFTEYL